jgi:hypothetical protein
VVWPVGGFGQLAKWFGQGGIDGQLGDGVMGVGEREGQVDSRPGGDVYMGVNGHNIYLLGTDTHIWKYIIDCSLCLLLLPMAILPLFLRRGGDGQLAEWFSQLAVLTSWQVMASWRTRFGQLAGDGPPAQPGGQSPSPPSPNRPSRHYHGPSSGVQAAESLGGGVAGPFQFHVENFAKAVPTGFFV